MLAGGGYIQSPRAFSILHIVFSRYIYIRIFWRGDEWICWELDERRRRRGWTSQIQMGRIGRGFLRMQKVKRGQFRSLCGGGVFKFVPHIPQPFFSRLALPHSCRAGSSALLSSPPPPPHLFLALYNSEMFGSISLPSHFLNGELELELEGKWSSAYVLLFQPG